MDIDKLLRMHPINCSLEVTPPSKGKGIKPVFETIKPFIEFKPLFVDVTYHYHKPGTLSIATAIKYKFGIETVPHIVCGGFTKEETENFLVELSYSEFESVMALRGDAPEGPPYMFTPKPNGFQYASELVEHIKNMNRGNYLNKEQEHRMPTNFCIGVGCYPEVHPESSSLLEDLKYFKLKQDLGASYAITQMFFEPEVYRSFISECREFGITLPIIPGIKVLSHPKQVEVLPQLFGCKIPKDLLEEVIRKQDDINSVKQWGVEHAVYQCEQLLKYGAPDLHFYVQNDPALTVEVMHRLAKR